MGRCIWTHTSTESVLIMHVSVSEHRVSHPHRKPVCPCACAQRGKGAGLCVAGRLAPWQVEHFALPTSCSACEPSETAKFCLDVRKGEVAVPLSHAEDGTR